LLSNATKYTERGFIDYSVSVVDFDEAVRNNLVDIDRPHKRSRRNANDEADTRSDFSLSLLEAEEGNVRLPDTCVLKIQVKDTGVGIPPERLEQILVPYSQAKLSDYRKYGGTGESKEQQYMLNCQIVVLMFIVLLCCGNC
jgi:signal transduction histidine kinase